MEKIVQIKAFGNEPKIALKTPKGTQDYGPKQMAIREHVIGILTDIFKRHGAETIDTPVFELREILMGKYGEESAKLVYDLADQGGEMCSLRYDLTVPFARYLAMNKIQNIKRYHIAKVYRRDQPVMTKGRFREFYQCDFDIAGQYDLMVPEAECLKIIDEVFTQLDIGNYQIKINHRLLLEGMFSICGIMDNDFKTVCSSVDKLDKQPWKEIQEELVKTKGINEEAVASLEKFVRLREENLNVSNEELLNLFINLTNNKEPPENGKIKKSIEELQLLLDYIKTFNCTAKKVVFDPSLARGLDYYTGAIYEVVIQDSEKMVGSLAAGGRYDKLVGIFATSAGGKKKKDSDVPCVGVSFGVERIFSLMETKENKCRISPTDVFVASAQKNMLKLRMELCSRLWSAGIRSEFSYKANPKMLNQLQYCEERQIQWVLIVGEEELKNGIVKLRNVENREETNLKMDEVVDVIKTKIKL